MSTCDLRQPIDWQRIATPGLFARAVSGGGWSFARHLRVLDEAVCEAIAGRGPDRLIVTMPPRHGKSEYCSKYLPAWYLGVFPDRRVLHLSHSADFGKSYGRRVRDLLRVHGGLFGVRVSEASHAADRWDLAGRDGGMVTAGVGGGAVTGRGGHLILVDDPIKNSEDAQSEVFRGKLWDWWQSTIQTRQEPGAVFVVIQTRWHSEDLAGRLAALPGWRTINFPAIAEDEDELGRLPGEALWPSRVTPESLERIRSESSLYWWLSLYQQRPSQHERAEWPEEYFREILTTHWPDRFEIGVMALDPSKGKDQRRGDYSACVFVGLAGGKLWVDPVVERLGVPLLCRRVCEHARIHRPDRFGLEANAFQDLLAGELDRAAESCGIPPLPIDLITNSVAKELRISRLGPYLSRGQIRVRDTAGGRLLVRQLREFPLGDYDDGPDGLEMAVRLLRHATSPPEPGPEQIILA